jgi:hypothetical protein
MLHALERDDVQSRRARLEHLPTDLDADSDSLLIVITELLSTLSQS